jgi:hypothetical protein
MDRHNKYVGLGRFMILHSPRFVDDSLCNNWARVGKMLTEVDTPFAPKFHEFSAVDKDISRTAALVMSGNLPMPIQYEKNVAVLAVPRRTRKARMTRGAKLTAKPVVSRPKLAAKTSYENPTVKRPRGRPRKNTI